MIKAGAKAFEPAAYYEVLSDVNSLEPPTRQLG